jgi:TAT (twin-arginine translocation) pathway signal sequence
MSVSRRRFLKSGAVTVLAAGIAAGAGQRAFGQQGHGPTNDPQIPFEAQRSPLFFFKSETFKPYVGGVFTAHAGAHSIQMTLTEVRDCTPSAKSLKVTKKARPSECFALVFKSDGTLTDLTTIYDVEHAALGTFPLFLTRRDAPDGTYTYEAVFNRAL